jgi:hypothetical protein
MWESGTTIVHKEVWAGRVWAARPLVVVEDTPERMLLWIPQGTVRKVPVTPPSRSDPATRERRIIENLARRDWVMGEHVWDVSSLWILHPVDWHTVLVSWRGDGSHYGWYVNLQCPFRRTAIGIEAMDLMLDIVVEPNLEWRWKDEDEFAEIMDRGIFKSATGERVRKEAQLVIDAIETCQVPFSEPWPNWIPQPSWGIPMLLDGWDDPDPQWP